MLRSYRSYRFAGSLDRGAFLSACTGDCSAAMQLATTAQTTLQILPVLHMHMFLKGHPGYDLSGGWVNVYSHLPDLMVESFLTSDRGSGGFVPSTRLKEPLPLRRRGPACGSLVGLEGSPAGLALLNHAGTTKSCSQYECA